MPPARRPSQVREPGQRPERGYRRRSAHHSVILSAPFVPKQAPDVDARTQAAEAAAMEQKLAEVEAKAKIDAAAAAKKAEEATAQQLRKAEEERIAAAESTAHSVILNAQVEALQT